MRGAILMRCSGPLIDHADGVIECWDQTCPGTMEAHACGMTCGWARQLPRVGNQMRHQCRDCAERSTGPARAA